MDNESNESNFLDLDSNLQGPIGLIQVGFWPIRAIHKWVEGILND